MPRTPAILRGSALQQEIRATEVKHGQAAIWWLGQATFCVKLGVSIIYLDPFYRAETDDPPTMQEMPLTPAEFTDADLICCTHHHYDHIDPKTLPGAAAASPHAAIVIPEWHREFTEKLGVPAARLKTLRGDDSVGIENIKVHAIPSAHQRLDFKPELGFCFLGYVIQGNGVTLYHSGDTQPYPGWDARLSKFKLDVAFLPISGVDNLFWQQAVYFCCNHQPRLAIPMHYGMFKGYTEDPQVFAKGLSINAPEQNVKVMQVGERVIFGA